MRSSLASSRADFLVSAKLRYTVSGKNSGTVTKGIRRTYNFADVSGIPRAFISRCDIRTGAKQYLREGPYLLSLHQSKNIGQRTIFTTATAYSKQRKLTWVLAPLIPLVALVELPPMKLFLSSNNYHHSHGERIRISYPCSFPATQLNKAEYSRHYLLARGLYGQRRDLKGRRLR